MKVLVTGGAGFIGAHLIRTLLKSGFKVSVLDNLSTGKLENIKPEAKFYEGDLLDRDLVYQCVSRERPEVVIHLAAQASVPKSLEDPSADASINISGSVNLFEASRHSGARKVIYASTAAVYGSPRYLPLDEQHPVQPISGYGLSKYTVERYLSLYRDLYGLDYTVLRFANVYGPGQSFAGEGGVVAIFLDRIMRGVQPVIHGDGKQTRDFIHVSDIVNAIFCALERGSGAVLNIATGHPASINRLFQIIKKETGYTGEPGFTLPRPGDIRESWFDIKKAKVELEWSPAIRLEQGIKTCLY
ncbi:MAG: GDP-mannose 4,6-dehydratase [Actinobacteria bacterium]|nr:GDP-mannose 4,6-dehydratase [Actinomycetota bacterium]